MKKCNKCGLEKPLTEFYKHGKKERNECKNCYNKQTNRERKRLWHETHREQARASHRKYRENNPDKIYDIKLQYNYGITFKDYLKMLEEQNNGCKICGRLEPGRKGQKYFCIDHDHNTGKIRGLLCSPCNLLVGLAEDNFSILAKASEYLREQFEYDNLSTPFISPKDRNDPNILCIDIECTFWDKNTKPSNMQSEIIEVGYAILNVKENTITENGSIFIKAEESTISERCKEFTGITQQQIDNGVSFQEACRIIEQDLKGGSRVWASCGDFDRKVFEEQCTRRDIKYPFIPQHLNIKPMCNMLFGKQMKGLGSILSVCKLQFSGRRHSGKDDALNVARILQHLHAKFEGDFECQRII